MAENNLGNTQYFRTKPDQELQVKEVLDLVYTPVYNPDGKEIIARDNEISEMRKEDVSLAYYGCHTDITIPYDELGSIRTIDDEGDMISIIEDGRFVLPGTEALNEPFGE